VDNLFKAQLYAVWEWNQVASNSGGQPVPVFYFLDYTKCQVNFYGTGPNNTPPISKINVTNGVTADNSYTQSNADLPASQMDLTKIFNDQIAWYDA
jgi:hypothetical protein